VWALIQDPAEWKINAKTKEIQKRRENLKMST
jgi:hypothetical protein